MVYGISAVACVTCCCGQNELFLLLRTDNWFIWSKYSDICWYIDCSVLSQMQSSDHVFLLKHLVKKICFFLLKIHFEWDTKTEDVEEMKILEVFSLLPVVVEGWCLFFFPLVGERSKQTRWHWFLESKSVLCYISNQHQYSKTAVSFENFVLQTCYNFISTEDADLCS